ncbi:hypothetical protein [Methanobacterium paludis]|uniref:Oligosaccharide repeat unit polymerase n=1 Tax=Methanobacterium paludis (strain DSM 25820 / JCM 18151 / SWAN1) TaxID=868131 RepID=F6D1Y1_METPW|nr:hypothetical protein [Methanobacterium paludis]AEG17270.1 hypothetical protein MSWAN_0224 [Methanobacterium paludis]
MLIAQNHLQFIIEVAILIHIGILLLFNAIVIPLSMVLFLSLVLTVILAALFGLDTTILFLPFLSHHEFTHPFGPMAVFAWVTLAASASLLNEVEIKSSSIKTLAYVLFFVIAVAGGLMHRSFLLLWFIGWAVGAVMMSKSFKRTSRITPKRIITVIITVLGSFGILELLSRVLSTPVLSPLLRISRLEDYAMPSLSMVIKNTTLWGHVQGSCFWGANCLGGSDGYISLPMNLINSLTLPFPLFAGVLVTKKDIIDYMLPGIFGVAFDFGYGSLILLLTWCMIVICTGFYILRQYRSKRRNGSRRYLGREALLIGALTAFIAQSIVGLFLFNRTINGAAMVTYMVLSALVMAHIISIRRRV